MFVPLAPLVTSLLQLWGYWGILTHILGDDILATGISGHPPTSLIVTWPFLQGNTFVFCSRLALSIRQITSETLVNTVWDSPAFIMKMPLWEEKKKKHGLEVLMLPQQPPFFTQQHTLETGLSHVEQAQFAKGIDKDGPDISSHSARCLACTWENRACMYCAVWKGTSDCCPTHVRSEDLSV